MGIKRQCELLGITRSSVYYKPKKAGADRLLREETIRHRLDYWHTQFPCYGVRKLRELLQRHDDIKVGRKLIRRYMNEMGVYAVYPKPRLSIPDGNLKLPYLLRDMDIFLPNQVWAVDITYIPMRHGHMYLTAIIDWYSRFIVGWSLSDTLDTAPVLSAVRRAIADCGTPGILNSDQGSQFSSDEYRKYLKEHGIRQSMDGKARWVDNVIIERWFRSLKTEYVYINEYRNPKELRAGIRQYIEEYNNMRPHQSHDYDTPAMVYESKFVA